MAATEGLVDFSYLSGADLRTRFLTFVKLSTAADLTVLLAGVNDTGIGVLVNKPNTGQVAGVGIMGEQKVTYGGTVTRGDPLTADANGKAITQTGQAPVLAYALESGVLNEIHAILMLARPASAGVAGSIITIPIDLLTVSTSAATVAKFTPGFAGVIKKLTYLPTVVSTTAGKAVTLTPKIATVAVTGGVLALTSANTNTMAVNVAASAVTALNAFAAADEITIVSSVNTAFVEGSGSIQIVLQ